MGSGPRQSSAGWSPAQQAGRIVEVDLALDRQFESPNPIQGRWKIDGIGLPEAVLRKVYFDNAARLLHWRPTGA